MGSNQNFFLTRMNAQSSMKKDMVSGAGLNIVGKMMVWLAVINLNHSYLGLRSFCHPRESEDPGIYTPFPDFLDSR